MIPDARIERWLRDDLGHHDVTNEVAGETDARLVTREDGVAAGVDVACRVFEILGADPTARVDSGDTVTGGETLVTIEGPARAVLRGERVAVNVLGHAAGIATETRAAVDAAHAVDESVRVAGTRKTTPGLRGLEKRAIAAGGGDTHRLDLSHMVMVKDNHIAEMGMEAAIDHFRERASFATQIEVEVETPPAGKAAAEAGADIVLFDNLPPSAVEDAVAMLPEDTLAEASGGIGLEDVADYAATGVDIISMGSLTHSADALDLSFRAV